MMRKESRTQRRQRRRRAFTSLILAISLIAGLVGPVAPEAQAASWMDPYVEQMVEWGVMRGDLDGSLDPERSITRAEFTAMVNRAYGYTEIRENPFEDIKPSDWYYEDIGIAYSAGYFKGTSATAYIASPNSTLTREEAAVIIGRNLMLEEGTGEALGFSDSREFEDWSRHMIEAVADEGIVAGDNGAFRPKDDVKRGEVAAMLVRALGTPIYESGEHVLGGVYGNVTIAGDGVTLKDTVIKGDLYISGGVGLGGVDLQNVTVLGKIVVAGSGESEGGGHSVTLRNVTADELVMDSPNDQFVTLKAEGLTNIAETNVRTGAYLEDVTEDGLGLHKINLDGAEGAAFQLAGNIKDVVNLTPASVLTMAQGVAATITVDEAATGSTLDIADKAVVKTLNLDTATTVTGKGDIDQLNVNAPGSTVEMLPDKITIRPGITAVIAGQVMDANLAAESSEDPRILSGYPAARNVAPTSADAVFKTNKKGTIYWALSALADGSVGEEDLIAPPVYSGKIIQSGTVAAAASDTEYSVKLNGLQSDGSYYVSAILVDDRGKRSAVKITAFETPDDTVPAFANGYPYTIIADGDEEREQIIQAMVMANKDCQMYYALFPSGSVAPTAADFKANSLTGNLGYGVVDLKKNTPYLAPQINSAYLQEETTYDLYLWLTDADGMNSSAVVKLTVTTLDKTPPVIQDMALVDVQTNSVRLRYTLNEPGTLYWAVVKSGAIFYDMDNFTGTMEEYAEELAGKLQVESGLNALVNGSSRAGSGGTSVEFTISGLEPQTAYDVYYVAKDEAGNYNIYDMQAIEFPYPVSTLDNEGPTVAQEFTPDISDDETNLIAYPYTTIRLVFSETVQGMKDLNDDGMPDKHNFLELYNDYFSEEDSNKKTEKLNDLAELLEQYIKLYVRGENDPVPVRNRTNENSVGDDWVIDFRKATFRMDPLGTGELIMTLPYNEDLSLSALNLAGGVTYYFTMEDLADTSTAANRMQGVRGVTTLQEFTTIAAQIMLDQVSVKPPNEHNPEMDVDDPWNFDYVFSAVPDSHKNMDNGVLWDLMVWCDTSISFKVYVSVDGGGKDWELLGDTDKVATISTSGGAEGAWSGTSIWTELMDQQFETLNQFPDAGRLYAIELTSIGLATKREDFNTPVTIQVTAVSGEEVPLENAGDKLNMVGMTYETVVENNAEVSDITSPKSYNRFLKDGVPRDGFYMEHIFTDKTAPQFRVPYPKLTATDNSVTIQAALDRQNARYYYLIAPWDYYPTSVYLGNSTTPTVLTEDVWDLLPKDGSGDLVEAEEPIANFVLEVKPDASEPAFKGSVLYTGGTPEIPVNGLQPKTKYVIYFVLQGESEDAHSEQAYVFGFETGNLPQPTIMLYNQGDDVGVKTSEDANVTWFLMEKNLLESAPTFKELFYPDHVAADKRVAFVSAGYSPSMTVLEAISTTVDAGAGDERSVFDAYANEAIYDRIYQAVVVNTGYSTPTASGKDFPTTKDITVTVDPDPQGDKMGDDTQYYFVAAARNKLATAPGEGYSFKAVVPIMKEDKIPPKIDLLTWNLSKVWLNGGFIYAPALYDNTQNQFPANGIYSGTVTISFDEPLYYSYTEGLESKKTSLAEIWNNGAGEETLKGYIGSSASDTVESVKLTGNSLEITFKNLMFDNQIILFNGGVISDAVGNSRGSLVLTFKTPLLNGGSAETRAEFKFDVNKAWEPEE